MKPLRTEFMHNPLAQKRDDGADPVMRLVATPVTQFALHPDFQNRTRFDVGIEFGIATEGGAVKDIQGHSYAMTQDVMDLGEGDAKGLRQDEVKALFDRFKMGRTKQPRAVAA